MNTSDSEPRNVVTGVPYSGSNVEVLEAAQEEGGYPTSLWLTYKQARALKAFVRKGEHGTRIQRVVRKGAPRTPDGQKSTDGAPDARKRRGELRVYFVFNVAQVDGLPEGLVSSGASNDESEDDE